jgi:NAD(P)-dependent dehydrogenase (short-subunit alcohol dehydrogenase family)
MTSFADFGYAGKRALVVGGATGMGAGVVEIVKQAGGEVIVMDRAEVTRDDVTFIQCDLSDRDSIESATDQVTGSIDAHFACAGVADGTPGIERINFIGHRHQIDRLIAKGQIARGAAIGFISSFAGAGWEANLPLVKEYLAITDFDDATKWAQENGKADYMFSKLAINAYVAGQAFELLKQGIRINAILPGPTDTPLARANADMWLGFASDYREQTGIEPSTPEEQAAALVFLCSDAATAITGFTLVTDAGYSSSGITESFPPAAPVVEFLRGPLYGN